MASYRARHGLAMQQGRASLGRRALLGLDEEEHPERGGFWRALFEAERPSGRSLSEASGEGRQGRDLVESPTAAPTLAPTFAPTLAPAIAISAAFFSFERAKKETKNMRVFFLVSRPEPPSPRARALSLSLALESDRWRRRKS